MIPLYIIGVSDDESGQLREKLEGALERIEKWLPITEARVTIKAHRKGGDRKLYEASTLIVAKSKKFTYTSEGWSLAEIAESIAEKISETESVDDKKRKATRRRG